MYARAFLGLGFASGLTPRGRACLRPVHHWHPDLSVRACMHGTMSNKPQDDSYCIRYARAHGGVVVTNDMYRYVIDCPNEVCLPACMVGQGNASKRIDSAMIPMTDTHRYVLLLQSCRDQLQKLEGDKEGREAMRKWLKGHLISFTFVGDEFIPNPDFRFEKA